MEDTCREISHFGKSGIAISGVLEQGIGTFHGGNPETTKGSVSLIQGGDLTVGFHAWIGRGCMNAYHVPVSRGDRREWWDPMTSLKVTWTLLNVPHATVVKDDSYAVGLENKATRDFGNSRDKGMGARH